MTAFTIFTAAASLLLAAGTITAAGTSASSGNMDSSCPPPDSPYETPYEKIKALITKYEETGSQTEELEFDWVVQPFIDPEQASSDSGAGKVPEKGMAKENDD